MELLSINGKSFDNFVDYKVSYPKITKGDRDAKGLLHLDLVAKKKKLQLKWGVLTQAEATALLNKFDELTTFDCTFMNPRTGGKDTIKAYCSDPEITLLLIQGDKVYYKDFALNIIEC